MSREEEKKPGPGEPPEEARPLGALRNIFGRMAFEKGPAYQDQVNKEDLGDREGLRRPGRRRVRKDRKAPGSDKPPEAFPGP